MASIPLPVLQNVTFKHPDCEVSGLLSTSDARVVKPGHAPSALVERAPCAIGQAVPDGSVLGLKIRSPNRGWARMGGSGTGCNARKGILPSTT